MQLCNLNKLVITSLFVSVTFFCNADTRQTQKLMSLDEVISRALMNDPWLQGNRLKQESIESQSTASGSLPDPTMSINLLNMPVDSWQFDQEAMTQFKVSVNQTLPRGDTLAINQSKLQLQASQYPYMRLDRRAKLESIVTQYWLDIFQAQQTIELIQLDSELFEQMVEIAKASYSNVVGKTRQQDIIMAQLERIKLQDRLTIEQQNLEVSIAKLTGLIVNNKRPFRSRFTLLGVTDNKPDIQLLASNVLFNSNYTPEFIADSIYNHPALKVIEVKYLTAKKSIELAEQKYKPKWSLNASYAYREDAPNSINMQNSMPRSDFFSVGVSFDLPLFTDNKQDKEVESRIALTEIVKTEKLLLLRKMISDIDKERQQLKRLKQRQILYKEQLLTQTHQQAETALTAYTNDDGSLASVIHARMAELNAKITALKINIELLKTTTRLNYYFVSEKQDQSRFSGE